VDIENLVVNGQAININGRPNQVVNFPGGQLIINAQTSMVNGNSGDVTVAAIQVNDFGCMQESLFAHATSCAHERPAAFAGMRQADRRRLDVGTPSGAKGTFAVSGGIRFGQFWVT